MWIVMSEQKPSLQKLLKVLLVNELDNVKIIQDAEKLIKTTGGQIILTQLKRDSEKHAEIIQFLISNYEDGSTPLFGDEKSTLKMDSATINQVLNKSLKVEIRILEHIQEAIEQAPSDSFGKILKMILEEEQGHHQILKDLLNQFETSS
jgi:rubrerythrin